MKGKSSGIQRFCCQEVLNRLGWAIFAVSYIYPGSVGTDICVCVSCEWPRVRKDLLGSPLCILERMFLELRL